MRGLGVTAGDLAPANTGIVGPGGVEPMAMVEDAIAGAKMWLSPSSAIAEAKHLVSGTSTLSGAQLAGLALVPALALMILPGLLGGRRRRR